MEALVVVIVLATVAALAVAAYRSAVTRVTVYEYERGLRYDDGRFTGAVSPGAYYPHQPRRGVGVADPVVASVEHQDAPGAMYASLQVALREAAARADIDDLLERRGELGPALRERAAEDVERVGLRRLVPDELEGGAPPDA